MNEIQYAISILFILTTHEFAHAIVAYWNGDDTAKNEGRLTLNPLKHLDPIGTLSMFLFNFGWAKPVPINPYKFKNKRLGMFTVAIAGIAINILTAFFAILILTYFNINFNSDFTSDGIVFSLVFYISLYGIVFAIFNLIPIPPLDGSKVIASFLGPKFSKFIYKYEKYFYFLLLILIFTGVVNKFLSPAVNYVLDLFIKISSDLWMKI